MIKSQMFLHCGNLLNLRIMIFDGHLNNLQPREEGRFINVSKFYLSFLFFYSVFMIFYECYKFFNI